MSLPLCLNTSTIKPQPTLEKIRLAAEAGFDAIELWVNDVYDHIARGEVSASSRSPTPASVSRA